MEERQGFSYTLQICLKNTGNLEKLLNFVVNQGAVDSWEASIAYAQRREISTFLRACWHQEWQEERACVARVGYNG